MTTALAKIESAKRALTEAKTLLPTASLSLAKELHDRAAAVRTYSRLHGLGIDIQQDGAEIQLRAARRLGELLAEQNPKASRPRLHDGTLGNGRTLPDGIDKMQSHRYQRIASLPKEAFEKHVAETRAAGEELTTASVLRLATPPKNERTVIDIDNRPVAKLPTAQNGWYGYIHEDLFNQGVDRLTIEKALPEHGGSFTLVATGGNFKDGLMVKRATGNTLFAATLSSAKGRVRRQCVSCMDWKDIEAFGDYDREPFEKHYYCKACERERVKSYMEAKA